MAKAMKGTSKKARSQLSEVMHQFRKNKGAMLGGAVVLIIIFIAVFADFLLDYDTQVIGQNLAERLQSPNANHWFGTDELGRDIFCRIMYGTRFSCSVGLVNDRPCHWCNTGSYRRFLRRLAGRIDHALYRYSRSGSEYAYGDRYCFRTWTEYLESDACGWNYERSPVCPDYKSGCPYCPEPGIRGSIEGNWTQQPKDHI